MYRMRGTLGAKREAERRVEAEKLGAEGEWLSLATPSPWRLQKRSRGWVIVSFVLSCQDNIDR